MSFFSNRNGFGNDSHCKCLVKSFNQTNGSTTFTDTARGGSHTLTPVAGAAHSTTRAKFGTSSMALLTNQYLEASLDSDFYFDDRITIDCYVNFVTQPGRMGFFGTGNINGANRGAFYNNTPTEMAILVEDGSINSFHLETIPSLSNDTWYHFAGEFDPVLDEGSLYFNGEYLGTGTIDKTEDLFLHAVIGSYDLGNGSISTVENYYMENFRFSRGILRYNKRSFTPPNRPY